MSVAQTDSRHLPIRWGMRGVAVLVSSCTHVRGCVFFCVCVPMSTCIYPSHMFDFYFSLSCRLSSDANSCSSVASQRLDSMLMFNADATLFCVKPPHPASVKGQVIYTIEDMSLTNRYISFFPLPPYIFEIAAAIGERSVGTLPRHVRPRGALALSVPAV